MFEPHPSHPLVAPSQLPGTGWLGASVARRHADLSGISGHVCPGSVCVGVLCPWPKLSRLWPFSLPRTFPDPGARWTKVQEADGWIENSSLQGWLRKRAFCQGSLWFRSLFCPQENSLSILKR